MSSNDPQRPKFSPTANDFTPSGTNTAASSSSHPRSSQNANASAEGTSFPQLNAPRGPRNRSQFQQSSASPNTTHFNANVPGGPRNPFTNEPTYATTPSTTPPIGPRYIPPRPQAAPFGSHTAHNGPAGPRSHLPGPSSNASPSYAPTGPRPAATNSSPITNSSSPNPPPNAPKGPRFPNAAPPANAPTGPRGSSAGRPNHPNTPQGGPSGSGFSGNLNGGFRGSSSLNPSAQFPISSSRPQRPMQHASSGHANNSSQRPISTPQCQVPASPPTQSTTIPPATHAAAVSPATDFFPLQTPITSTETQTTAQSSMISTSANSAPSLAASLPMSAPASIPQSLISPTSTELARVAPRLRRFPRKPGIEIPEGMVPKLMAKEHVEILEAAFGTTDWLRLNEHDGLPEWLGHPLIGVYSGRLPAWKPDLWLKHKYKVKQVLDAAGTNQKDWEDLMRSLRESKNGEQEETTRQTSQIEDLNKQVDELRGKLGTWGSNEPSPESGVGSGGKKTGAATDAGAASGSNLLKPVESERDALASQLQDANGLLDAKSSELAKAMARIQQLELDNKGLRERRVTENDRAKTAKAELASQLAAVEEAKAKLTSQVAVLEEANGQLTERVQEVEIEREKKMKELKEEREATKREVAELRKDNAAKAASEGQLLAHITSTERKMADDDQQHQAVVITNARLEQEVEALRKDRVGDLEALNHMLDATNISHKDEAVVVKLQNVHFRLDELANKVMALDKEKSSAAVEAKKRRSSLEDSLAVAQQEARACQEKVEDLEKKLSRLESARGEAASALESAHQEAAQHSQAFGDITTSICRVYDSIRGLDTLSGGEQSEQEMLDQLEKTMKEMGEEIEAQRAELERLEQENESLKCEVGAAQTHSLGDELAGQGFGSDSEEDEGDSGSMGSQSTEGTGTRSSVDRSLTIASDPEHVGIQVKPEYADEGVQMSVEYKDEGSQWEGASYQATASQTTDISPLPAAATTNSSKTDAAAYSTAATQTVDAALAHAKPVIESVSSDTGLLWCWWLVPALSFLLALVSARASNLERQKWLAANSDTVAMLQNMAAGYPSEPDNVLASITHGMLDWLGAPP